MDGIINAIMNKGGCFHNLHKLAKMTIFTKKTPVHEKKLTSRMLTQPPKF